MGITTRSLATPGTGTAASPLGPAIVLTCVNAAAEAIDPEVVTDRRLIPNRSPQDLPAFCRAIIECFAAALRTA